MTTMKRVPGNDVLEMIWMVFQTDSVGGDSEREKDTLF